MSTNFVPTMSTDEIGVGTSDVCLTDYLDGLENTIAGKAEAEHTHSGYMSESDAMDAFATADHAHTGYAPATHTHDDLVELIDAMDTNIGNLDAAKAAATHTHEQSEITGLVDKLTEIDTAIAALQAAGGDESTGEVTPMLVCSMHLGKLDNNSGSESTSSTRICSDSFAVAPGNSYWQVNDNGVNMYVLIYDADELFLEYMGNFASGAEIAKGCIEQDKKGFYSLRAADLVFPLIAAVQALTKRVEELEGK